MSGFNLAVALVAAAAFAISKFFGKKGDDPPPHPPPPRDSYYSYNSGTWNQTQQSYRPPQQPYRPSQQSYRPSPPPSYHHRSLATKAPSQTTTRTPTSPDYGYDDYHPSASYIRAPIQTQPSTRSQTTARTSAPPDYDYDDYGLSAAHVRAPCQTRPPTRSQTTTRGSAPPDYGYDDYDLSAAHVRALSQRQPSTRTRSSRAYSSLFDSGNVHEPLESGWSPLSSHTPSHVYTGSELPPPTVIQVISPDRRPDEPASVEDLDFAKKLREQARRRGREMSEARSRAKSAQKKGYRGAANAHRQEAIAYESAMKKLDKRAAKIIFRENNKNRREGGKIDLHGLYVAEAVQFAKDQIQAARSRGDEVARFIVGKGLHSDDGEARIRPALEDHFTTRGLSHLLDPNNAGVLIVRLD